MDMNLIFGGLGLVIGLVVPVVYKEVKVGLAFIKSKLGDKNYAECKAFLLSLAELHPEDFAEDKVVALLDSLDDKFGDHLNKTQIKEIVDFVSKTVVADVTKETVVTGAIDASKIVAGVISNQPIK